MRILTLKPNSNGYGAHLALSENEQGLACKIVKALNVGMCFLKIELGILAVCRFPNNRFSRNKAVALRLVSKCLVSNISYSVSLLGRYAGVNGSILCKNSMSF